MGAMPTVSGMNTDVRLSRRWVAAALSAAMFLGACSSSSTEESSDDAPSELALDTETVETEVVDTEQTETEVVDTEEAEAADDLPPTEFTPEMFEELKSDDVARAAVLQEMQGQGLEAEQAECFLDNVSAGLFSTFSAGVQPDDAQFSELLELLEICEIAFGADS